MRILETIRLTRGKKNPEKILYHFGNMDLSWALIIWLIVVILVFILARNFRIRFWSALVLALIVGAIVLGIITPVNNLITSLTNRGFTTSLYALIMFLTPLIVLIYAVSKAVTDVQPSYSGLFTFQ